MTKPLDIVFLGLSLSSSWGNGHATTYRALIKGLRQDGHRILFLERDVPWYASHRDLVSPEFCDLAYYTDVDVMIGLHGDRLRGADAVVVGSYVPDGVALIDKLERLGPKRFCFYDIDTPVTLAKLDRGDEEYLALRQILLFDAYFSFSGGTVLTLLERSYGARRAIALYCSVDESRYADTGEPKCWDLGYLGTYSQDRQPTLERLLLEPARRLPSMRFVVAGPRYPADIDWPANVQRIEHLAPAAHASFYTRQRFTLNVTRSDMIAAGWSPSVRLFEAAACGTPVISDFWQGLDQLLPDGEALIIARGPEDVVAVLTELADSDRAAIAAAARRRVMDGHTGLARAGEFARTLSELPVNRAYERISA
ncbi:glycosyltransferase domain-containing protein (plasmid) [Rhizobium etli bv. phaseoli str. IE4803]|uniref:Glycosyltransferase domain-containing protein n=1 Tax=Rhizobium etli bv. mimosae str. IE4771 TaxID=1432050 RepID=A0A060IDD1_RHIET|nr:glycosyltransferase [Rhizobium sp. IE4771]AIC31609.1 glycosyltransferase domain-containing protein [Rhizobium sp. IE4771]AJC83569.1 glycosyltransferase domain-containing protein [Rhizobium etli bv. phaseoli str. IE4803]